MLLWCRKNEEKYTWRNGLPFSLQNQQKNGQKRKKMFIFGEFVPKFVGASSFDPEDQELRAGKRTQLLAAITSSSSFTERNFLSVL